MSRMPRCEVCNKEFYRKPYDIKRSKHLFCSWKCYLKWRQIPQNNWNWNNVLVTCDWCGKSFYKIPTKIRKYNFCSRPCCGKWKSKNLRGSNSHLWKKRITVVCLQCKKKFSLSRPCRPKKFCSNSCRLEYQRYKPKKSAVKMSSSLAYVIGAILSDGNVDKKRKAISLGCTDREFAEYFSLQFERWSGIQINIKKQNPRIKRYNGKTVICKPIFLCRIKSAVLVGILYNYLDDFAWTKKLDYTCKVMLLKGLWDGEGYLYKSYRQLKIIFGNTDPNIITLYTNLIKKVLNTTPSITVEKMKNKKHKDFYRVIIHNNKNFYNFLDIIGVTIKRKLDKIKNENFLNNISR